MSNDPKVTCWCPTRNRRAWLPRAIQCFEQQTYGNCELLIVADGEDISDLVPKNDSRVTFCTITESERPRLLANKFNLCCGLAKGEILCKWDDDDWYSPNRVTDQVALLQSSGKALVGCHSALFHDGTSWYGYRITPPFAIGTSLCFTRAWWEKNPFVPPAPNIQTGSDKRFSDRAKEAGQLHSVEGGEMIVASIHARNSSPRRIAPNSSSYRRLANFAGVAGYVWPLQEERAA